MPITYQIEGVPTPDIRRREVLRWIKEVASIYDKKLGAISFVFCSDEYILRINSLYLKHDYYTDIITFDYGENGEISGDIFISLETVKSNSEKYKTDYIEELHRVIIHGVLHLCGINDKSAKERADMRKKEDEALKMLDYINLK